MEIFKKKTKQTKQKPKKKNNNTKENNTKTPIRGKIEKIFICYKAKVLKYYNECSKTNTTRNKRIPKFRSLKYKHT